MHINRVRFNEANEAKKHLVELPCLVGDKKSIVVLDGYPSLPMFYHFQLIDQKFVIRIPITSYAQEQKSMVLTTEQCKCNKPPRK